LIWWAELLLLVLCVFFFFGIGVPVAFSFGIVNLIALYFFCGGAPMLSIVASSTSSSIMTFTLVAVPLFILMGEVLAKSKIIELSFDALDKWLYRLPARLAIVSISSATLFAALSGSSMASCAAIGSSMIPEMRSRGYDSRLSIGTIMAGGGLAILIPPSFIMVIYGTLSGLSVGKLLIGGLLPGIILALAYSVYVVIRVLLNPALAPKFESGKVSFREKLAASKHLISMALLVVLVVWVIYAGVCTPTEAAAMGAVGAFVIAAVYKRLSFTAVKESIHDTIKISSMVFLILAGSRAFSQVLAITGASHELCDFVVNLPFSKYVILVFMQFVILCLGCFMESISILFIIIPIYMPIVQQLGFDPLWFAIITMMTLEAGLITPPFGLNLFVVKAISPEDITMRDIYRSSIPFFLMHLTGIVVVMLIPEIAVYLPSLGAS
jgi:tripartite ATP-independent transporter DctM subunit